MSEANAGENQAPSLYVQTFIVFPAALLAVVLRFVSRYKGRAGYWWDDWMILIATVMNIGFTAASLLVFQYGLGRHAETLPPNSIEKFLSTYFAGQIFYASILATVKWSILCLYWKLFSHVPKFRPLFWSLMALSTAWFLTTFWGCIFSCNPISYAWSDPATSSGTCIDKKAFFLAVSAINSFTDLCLLALPIYFIAGLQMQGKRLRKIGVMVMFLLGGFVCIVTFVRIGVLVHTDFNGADQSWIEVSFAEWTNIEVNVAIISACLPAMGNLFPRHGSEASSTAVDHSPANSNRLRRSSTRNETFGYNNLSDFKRATYTSNGGTPIVEFQPRTRAPMFGYHEGVYVGPETENGPRSVRDEFELLETV